MKRKNDLLVGAVVLVVIFSLIGTTLWVQQTDIKDRRSKVVARFHDVGNARVGNSVVLHGVPYLPPYKITAIGDRKKLQQALDDSKYIENLQDYVVRFQLGYEVKNESSIQMPAYEGTLELQSATVPRFEKPPTTSPSATGGR